VGSPSALADLAEALQADLTVVGPEAPLVAGVADHFALRQLRLVGPTAGAARLEGSKIFAKEFMSRHRIPTARFAVCDSPRAARDACSQFNLPVVVKADGLAAGKGVRIPCTELEFDQAIEAMMVDKVFGAAGSRVLLEECLVGREASLMLFTDGSGYQTIVPAQDYKRVFDGDQGPNTGGMGSFSTPGLIDQPMHDLICRRIVEPTLEGMRAEGNPFSGILYCGLMLTAEGPQVIEFNCRLGDPETQAVLMRLDDDLVDICEAIADRRIGSRPINWSDDSSVCVVAASGGYPGEFEKGKKISGLDEAGAMEGVEVFHAGSSCEADGGLVTSGGRVLGVTARGATLEGARARAYDAMSRISFEGLHYRRDIGSLPGR
jgi:phosphoribosylamine--glycine ligase